MAQPSKQAAVAKPASLLGLPREIRDIIWEHVASTQLAYIRLVDGEWLTLDYYEKARKQHEMYNEAISAVPISGGSVEHQEARIRQHRAALETLAFPHLGTDTVPVQHRSLRSLHCVNRQIYHEVQEANIRKNWIIVGHFQRAAGSPVSNPLHYTWDLSATKEFCLLRAPELIIFINDPHEVIPLAHILQKRKRKLDLLTIVFVDITYKDCPDAPGHSNRVPTDEQLHYLQLGLRRLSRVRTDEVRTLHAISTHSRQSWSSEEYGPDTMINLASRLEEKLVPQISDWCKEAAARMKGRPCPELKYALDEKTEYIKKRTTEAIKIARARTKAAQPCVETLAKLRSERKASSTAVEPTNPASEIDRPRKRMRQSPVERPQVLKVPTVSGSVTKNATRKAPCIGSRPAPRRSARIAAKNDRRPESVAVLSASPTTNTRKRNRPPADAEDGPRQTKKQKAESPLIDPLISATTSNGTRISKADGVNSCKRSRATYEDEDYQRHGKKQRLDGAMDSMKRSTNPVNRRKKPSKRVPKCPSAHTRRLKGSSKGDQPSNESLQSSDQPLNTVQDVAPATQATPEETANIDGGEFASLFGDEDDMPEERLEQVASDTEAAPESPAIAPSLQGRASVHTLPNTPEPDSYDYLFEDNEGASGAIPPNHTQVDPFDYLFEDDEASTGENYGSAGEANDRMDLDPRPTAQTSQWDWSGLQTQPSERTLILRH